MNNQARIDSVVNEGGEGYSLAVEQADAIGEAKYNRELEAKRNAWAAEWTREVTESRKAAWNAEMANLQTKGQKVTQSVLNDISAKLGFSWNDLRVAVERHQILAAKATS